METVEKTPEKKMSRGWIYAAIAAGILLSFACGLAVGGVGGFAFGRGRALRMMRTPMVTPRATPTPQTQPRVTPRAQPRQTPVPGDSSSPTFQYGAVIRWVEQNGPADQAGLKEGDAITAVNGQTLSPQQDLATILQAFKPGDRIQVAYWRAGSAGRQSQQTVKVTLGSRRDEQGNTVAYLGIRYSLVEGRNLTEPAE